MTMPAQLRNHHSRIGAVALLLAAILSCTGTAGTPTRSCDVGCDEGQLCWYARGQCVPAAKNGGICPSSYVYNDCATGSCPLCRDCVAACLPEDALP
jgi:hypothetical protein